MGFCGYLQANTAVDVLIGPFIDDTDGKSAETGLTLSQADIKLSKNGQTLAQKNDDTAATHDANGYYNCELDATDTNTEGTLTLIVHESGALPVRHDFMVLAQAAYISLVTAKDSGYMDVNVKAVSEDTTAADNAELMFDGTGYAGGTTKLDVNVASIANDAITAAAIQNGAIDAATFAANAITSTVIADDAITAAKLNTGAITADAFAANAIEAAAIKDGAITNAKVADDVDVNVKTITAGAIAAASLNADMDAELATIIWNAAVASYGGAGTYGQAVEDILADTNELQVDDTPTAVAAVKTVVDAVKVQTDKLAFTVANQVDANIQYINDTAVTGDGGATPWGPA